MVLNTDLRKCAACILPLGIDQMQDQHLPGPYVVQVSALLDRFACLNYSFTVTCHVLFFIYSMQVLEVKNIGEALETRNKESAKRCLRLTLTDGQQTVVGWEYRPPLRGLDFCPPAHPPIGLKVGYASLSGKSAHNM